MIKQGNNETTKFGCYKGKEYCKPQRFSPLTQVIGVMIPLSTLLLILVFSTINMITNPESVAPGIQFLLVVIDIFVLIGLVQVFGHMAARISTQHSR